MAELFRTTIYIPLYNALVGLVALLPHHSVGFAVILLTILVKTALLPFSLKAARMQEIMKQLQPELEAIKKKHKGDQEKLARATLEAYRKHNLNPFSMIVPILVQIPVIIGLFWVFSRGGITQVDASLLYSFISAPTSISTNFFGIDLASRSALMAVLAGAVQFAQFSFSMPKPQPRGEKPSFAEEFQRTFQIQARYLFPILIGFVAWTLPSAVALYFIVSSVYQLGQDWFIRRMMAREQAARDNKQAEAAAPASSRAS